MGTRTLVWEDLRVMGQSTSTPVIAVAGVPARVKRTRANDIGFYVRDADEDVPTNLAWMLKTATEVELLRKLVDAGQVTIDDPTVPTACFVAGCTSEDVDGRGPIRTTDGREMPACTPHWTAVFEILGEQDRDGYAYLDDHLEQVIEMSSDRVLREFCAVCGGRRGNHDLAKHNEYEQREAERERREEAARGDRQS